MVGGTQVGSRRPKWAQLHENWKKKLTEDEEGEGIGIRDSRRR